MSGFLKNLNPTAPCPHCSHAIAGTAFKGLNGIKECPSCHKKIKFKKPPFGDIVKATWKPFAVFMAVIVVVAALCIALLGSNTIPQPLFIAMLIVYLLGFQMPAMAKLYSFEKDE